MYEILFSFKECAVVFVRCDDTQYKWTSAIAPVFRIENTQKSVCAVVYICTYIAIRIGHLYALSLSQKTHHHRRRYISVALCKKVIFRLWCFLAVCVWNWFAPECEWARQKMSQHHQKGRRATERAREFWWINIVGMYSVFLPSLHVQKSLTDGLRVQGHPRNVLNSLAQSTSQHLKCVSVGCLE